MTSSFDVSYQCHHRLLICPMYIRFYVENPTWFLYLWLGIKQRVTENKRTSKRFWQVKSVYIPFMALVDKKSAGSLCEVGFAEKRTAVLRSAAFLCSAVLPYTILYHRWVKADNAIVTKCTIFHDQSTAFSTQKYCIRVVDDRDDVIGRRTNIHSHAVWPAGRQSVSAWEEKAKKEKMTRRGG